jgi:hypothetical protein
MSLEGTIIDGKVVFDEPAPVSEGTRVEVTVKQAPESEKPTLLNLLSLAGIATNLPADFAAEHDHYIHGAPRRNATRSE